MKAINKITLNNVVQMDASLVTATESDVWIGVSFLRNDGLLTDGSINIMNKKSFVTSKTTQQITPFKEIATSVDVTLLPVKISNTLKAENISSTERIRIGYDTSPSALMDIQGTLIGITPKGCKYVWSENDFDKGEYDVTNYEYLAIDGQSVPDNTIRFWIKMDNPDSLQVSFGHDILLGQEMVLIVDWGDGSSERLRLYNASSLVHNYTECGNYVIALAISSDNHLISIDCGQSTGVLYLDWCPLWKGSFTPFLSKAMAGDSIAKIIIEQGIAASFNLWDYAFANCNLLKEVYISKSCSVYSYAFSNCPVLKTVHMINSKFEAGNVFNNCVNLENVYLDKCIFSLGLGAYVFNNCPNLKNVILSLSVGQNIEYTPIFTQCGSPDNGFVLTLLTEDVVTIDHRCDTLWTNSYIEKIYVPASLVTEYQDMWPDYATIIESIPS